jgi:hypothetical protein
LIFTREFIGRGDNGEEDQENWKSEHNCDKIKERI